MISVSVQEADFSVDEEYKKLLNDCPKAGAIVTFTGLMRDFNDGDTVSALNLEHYPGMTEKVLTDIAEQTSQRWPTLQIRVVHRFGDMYPSDQIVFVGVSSAHRKAAFEACEFLMDFLKTKAPFWKKEVTDKGSRWVEQKDSDKTASQRWVND